MPEIYWNCCVGGVELKPTDDNCPIFRGGGEEDIVIESWFINEERSMVINYIYSRAYPHSLDRRNFFRSHDIDPDDDNLRLRYIRLPVNEYDGLIENYGTENEYEALLLKTI